TGLNGFFVQEETVDQDSDALSSEGLFVFDRNFGVAVAANDVVRVAGTVREQFGQTELFNITSVQVCSSNASAVSATPVTLPFSSLNFPEQLEGMLVTLPQKLAVTNNFTLARFGEVELSSESRLVQPTQVAAPGAAANALQASNNLNRLLIDDANGMQNRDPVVYPGTGLSAFNTLRGGDSVSNLTGVMGFGFNVYRVQPTVAPQFVAENPRTAAPDLPGQGSLRVASFNVLNYFNGDGAGGGFPTARGANTPAEFTRQRDKVIAAISALQADVIGLIEIENDGYASNSAIADLVNGLNAAAPAGTSYAFVDVGGPIGTDQIAVGFVYRVQTAAPLGAPAILDSRVDARFIDTKNRPALAQTFREIASNARFTAAVNHFKSKGSACDDVGDPDLFDGAGNCNVTRRNAALALVDWLATDPTQSGDPDFLVIGDLNSYAQEEPITTLRDGGFTNLVDLDGSQNPPELSYTFDGQWGTLDYGLANAGLLAQVTGATEWLINGAEPIALDYNTEFKSAGQQALFYNADPYRSSDHDPVVIELALCGPGTLNFAAAPYQVQEADGDVSLSVTVTRSNGRCGAIGVSYAASAGAGGSMATAGADFIETSGTLSWADGETGSKSFEVLIKADALDEADEVFGLALAGATGGALLPDRAETLSTIVTILDNDAAPQVRFSVANNKVEESAGLVTVQLELSALSGRDVIVPLQFGGSATRDGLTGDYSVSGVDALDRITIPAGSRTALLTLALVDDSQREADETIEVRIDSAVFNADRGALASHVLSIKDRDKKPKKDKHD
ncbi:MAG: ExeM/NucH family extracellular endonuclease, partial [Pseudomonadota bacterium]